MLIDQNLEKRKFVRRLEYQFTRPWRGCFNFNKIDPKFFTMGPHPRSVQKLETSMSSIERWGSEFT